MFIINDEQECFAIFNCSWIFFVAIFFCSETRFVEVVEHACDENSKEVCMYFC